MGNCFLAEIRKYTTTTSLKYLTMKFKEKYGSSQIIKFANIHCMYKYKHTKDRNTKNYYHISNVKHNLTLLI